jgi:small-conductance mechanosensitive channel
MDDKLIKTKNLYPLIDFELLILVTALFFLAWIFYKLFLNEVSEERHQNLKNHFYNLSRNFFILCLLFFSSQFLMQAQNENWSLARSLPYVALLTFVWGVIVFVKVSRLIILQYLFLGSMRAGVPVLIVNIFSLAAMVVLFTWGASTIFGLQLGPLMATSAAFSLILGLALQDTLGNLFAGISLQVDHTFEIGDWLEISQGTSAPRTVGQVKEITWRSTILLGWSDELITIPNRVMANSQIFNFRGGTVPILRSQLFRLPLNADVELVKKALNEAIKQIPRIREYPSPIIFVSETTDSWLSVKCSYYIDNYGSQFSIGDTLIEKGLEQLRLYGLDVSHNILELKSLAQK